MVPVTGLSSLLATAMGLPVSQAKKNRQAITTWPATCAGPAYVQHALARPDSQFLCCTCVYFLRDILWPQVQSHSDNSHRHATGLHFARALTQALPIMCIHLVIYFNNIHAAMSDLFKGQYS